jgi:transcriptional regulator with XRE-family HTH domain
MRRMSKDTELRAARLREARQAAGFENATEAAERFGWEVVTYRSHENGIRGLRPTVAKKYAKAYEISLSWLMTGEGIMKGPGIDAELMELPADIASPLIEAVRRMIRAAKPRGKV